MYYCLILCDPIRTFELEDLSFRRPSLLDVEMLSRL